MTIPLWTLLAFIAWTLIMLVVLSICRWMHIVRGDASLQATQPEYGQNHPSDFHKRAMRAHLNCLENLPIYTGLIFIAYSIEMNGPYLDGLTLIFIAARVTQSLIHISLPQTNRIIPFRSFFYGIQFIIYIVLIFMTIYTISVSSLVQ